MRNNRARSFVTIMIIIAVSALVLRIAVEQIIKINIAQNESNAQSSLRLISTALENYAKDHLGAYPQNLSVLIQETPRYLDRDYLADSPLKGYDYNCLRLDASGYSCSANPVKCNLSGRMTYSVTTGGLIISEDCSRKE